MSILPALFERPAGATIEREFADDIEADADAVYAQVARRVDPGDVAQFAVDPEGRRLVIQGSYWYRGEYLVEQTANGSRLRHTILNVAPGWHVLGVLTGRRELRAAPAAFATLVDEVRAYL